MKLVILLFVTFALSCANSGEESEKSEPSSQSRQVGIGDQDLETNPTSRIVLKFADNVSTTNLSGYVVGQAGIHLLGYNETYNFFSFEQLPIAAYDIVILATGSDGQAIGRRYNGVQVVEERNAVVSDITLPPLTRISGTVFTESGSAAEGSQVTVAGTNISTSVDAQGNYTVEGIPYGIHRFEYIASDFETGFIDLYKIEQPPEIGLPSMILGKSSQLGLSIIGEANSLQIPFLIRAPSAANQFRISQSQNFGDSNWQNLISHIRYGFTEEGPKQLFIQFSNNGTQLSTVYSLDFEIVLSSP
ncbi:MAG: carboxypeptidase regulatory-like domain-containing protein [Pseudobacteriovorax sp.]|nr:carboxypeptidase regulatory-like domain-containing protein [Pseudobacteriovorax sp.]